MQPGRWVTIAVDRFFDFLLLHSTQSGRKGGKDKKPRPWHSLSINLHVMKAIKLTAQHRIFASVLIAILPLVFALPLAVAEESSKSKCVSPLETLTQLEKLLSDFAASNGMTVAQLRMATQLVADAKDQINHFDSQDLTDAMDFWEEAALQASAERNRADRLQEIIADLSSSIKNRDLISRPSKNSETGSLVDLPPHFPSDFLGVVGTHSVAFKSRLLFLPEAFKSAKKAKSRDVKTLWKMLWAMGTTLYDLYFENKLSPVSIGQIFKTTTGFDYAPSESQFVNRREDLKDLRFVYYNGKQVSMSAHIKHGSRDPDIIRIHYYVDRANKLIVIGHVGDHLENGGTRFQ